MGGTPAIQGLPAGASVTPIQGMPAGATATPIASSAVQGMPAGASVKPMGAASAQDDGGHWYDPAVNYVKSQAQLLKDQAAGVGQAAAGSIGGLADTMVKGPGKLLGKDGPNLGTMAPLAMIPGYDKVRGALQSEADKPLDSFGKQEGSLMENILEFEAGNKSLEGLSLGEKAAHLGKLASTIEKYPVIAKVLGTGLKQGALGAAQGIAHGEDAEQAATTGAVTGAGGALLEGAGQAVGKVVSKVRPGTRSIAGVEVPTLRSQEPGASAIARDAATSDPGMAATQQAGGKEMTANVARDAVKSSIARLNRTRIQPDLTPSRLLPAPGDLSGAEGPLPAPAPYKFSLQTAEPAEVAQTTPEGSRTANDPPQTPEQQQEQRALQIFREKHGLVGTPPSAPGKQLADAGWQYNPPPSGETSAGQGHPASFSTSDPAVAHAHLSRLEELMDTPGFEGMSSRAQRTMTEQAADLQKQIEDHGAYRARMSHFQPVDADATAAQVGNFRQAADMLTRSTQDTWNKINDVSDGTWNTLRDQEKKWLNSTADNADEKLAEVRAQQQSILDGAKEQISPDELQAAKSTYRDASTLRDLHKALTRSFDPIPEDVAARTGLKRTMDGNKAMRALSNVLTKREGDVRRVLGNDGLDNLYRMADLLKTPAKAEATRGMLGAWGNALRRHGHTIGGLAGGAVGFGLGGPVGAGAGIALGAGGEVATVAAYRRALHAAATNPALAARLSYAVEHNATPRVVAPLLAHMTIQQQQP